MKSLEQVLHKFLKWTTLYKVHNLSMIYYYITFKLSVNVALSDKGSNNR